MFGRLSALTRKHAELDLELKAEASRPAADPIQVRQLKKQKLAVKDEIAARQRRRRRYRNQNLEYPGLGV